MGTNDVSIIIPALNEEAVIGLCLDSLVRLESPQESFEVIVVDNGSTDRTLEIAQSYSKVLDLTVLQKADAHVSALRNLGASQARGALFAFLDADCIVPPGWLTQATTLLAEIGVGVVGAHFRIPHEAGWVARTWYGKLDIEKQGDLTWIPACNTWVSRETFNRLGGFDETIETNEDCEFCSRVRAAGYRVIGDSRIAVLHLGSPDSVGSFYRKNYWHATDGLRVFLRNPLALSESRPVLFGFYTLICLAGMGIGLFRFVLKKQMAVPVFFLVALLLPSFLLSLRLCAKRQKWSDFFPLIFLNLVYGLARARALLMIKNWGLSIGRRLQVAAPVLLFLLLYPIYWVLPASAAAGLTAIWANTGEDKVTRDELRATNGATVTNSVWDGTKISIFGGRNEVVSFNVILEAGSSGASNVTVSFNSLTGPSGAKIASAQATGDGVFSWTGRNIELFYVRYLQINGLSLVSYPTNVDERQVPQRFERPWSGNGVAAGGWTSRPDHNKYYPEIAVPLELVPNFNITAGQNQSIWVDVYIPKTVAPGNYAGQFLVQVNGQTTTLPVFLQVYNFTLPDTPNSKTMVVFDSSNINQRFLGSTYVVPDSAAGSKASLLRNRYIMLAHRHRISLIGDSPGNDCDQPGDQPCPDWTPRLTGSLFSSANGYDGPGVGVGNNVYSIGTYGAWSWNTGTEADMNTHTNNWATWLNQNVPGIDYFLYLDDESTNYTQTQTWAQWILNNPGPGNQIRSMATLSLVTAASQAPALDIPTSTLWEGITSQWDPLDTTYANDARKRFYMYNGHKPASGSFAIEDDGIALRELAWGQYKKHINRWYFWQSTYYNNSQGSMGQTNVFENAQTFGTNSSVDPVLGATGWNYSNGDGVLFYPGTDTLFPSDSYGVDGPFASLRLKYWRRGIQDVDYLTLAAAINPTTTQTIVNNTVPKVLWEYGVDNPADPSYVHSAISWSNDPNVWEAARAQLAGIIAGGGQLVAPGLNLPSMLPVNSQITASYPSGYALSGYQWAIVASIPPAGSQAQAPRLTAASTPGTFNLKTAGGTAQLAPLNLPLGYYEIAVTVTDASGNVSPPAFAYVTLVASDLSALRVYPNPWRSDRHSGSPIIFDHLTEGTTIKIFTVSGHLTRSLDSTGGIATWDLNNDSGQRVASGIYLYFAKATDNQISRGQLAIVR